jgi:hypothetical protein
MSVASQAASILIAADVGYATGNTWPIKLGRFVDEPDAQIRITDTPGSTPNPKFLLDFATFQVAVRGPKDDYEAGWTKMRAAKDALLGIDPINMVGGDRWDGITGIGDINFLTWDDNSRPIFVGNYRVILEPATNALTHRESL